MIINPLYPTSQSQNNNGLNLFATEHNRQRPIFDLIHRNQVLNSYMLYVLSYETMVIMFIVGCWLLVIVAISLE